MERFCQYRLVVRVCQGLLSFLCLCLISCSGSLWSQGVPSGGASRSCTVVANCKNATVSLDANGKAVLAVAMINDSSYSSCLLDSFWLSRDTLDCGDLPGVAVQLYVRDTSGVIDSCLSQVTVLDLQPGVFTGCPQNIVQPNRAGNCGRLVTWIPPGVNDNCALDTLIASHLPGRLYPVGITRVTYLAWFEDGSTDTCSFSVEIQDVEPPVISNCPASVFVNNRPGLCNALVSWNPPLFNDNCPGLTVNASHNSPAVFPVGVSTVTYTVIDRGGNLDSCSFQVTVSDIEPPVISCPANISVGTDSGQCAATVNYLAPVGTDNCNGVTIQLVAGSGSGGLFQIGTTTETYLVTDGAGLSDSCSFTITVTDDDPPVFSFCPPFISIPNNQGTCGAVANWTTPLASDNCGQATLIGTHFSGNFFLVGTTQVLYTATDPSGNVDSCLFSITVTDQEAPQIQCPGDTSLTSDPGSCSAAYSYQPPQGTDICPGANTQLVSGLGSGGIFPVGTTTEAYQVTDAAGQTASCSFVVTVTDGEAPVISGCPVSLQKVNDPGICGANVTWTSPNATDNCLVSLSASQAPGSFFGLGTTSVLYTATDPAGNADTCSFTVTVVDNEAPILTCPTNLSVANDPGQCGAAVSWSLLANTDNCGVDSIFSTHLPGDTFVLGTTQVSYSSLDAAGNTASCSLSVTVTDNEPPVLTCPSNITVPNNAAFCAALVSYQPPVGTDNCPGVTTVRISGGAPGSLFFLGTSAVAYRATDAAGNFSICNFTITVTDNEPPVVTCPPSRTVNSDSGVCGAVVNFPNATFSDNCPGTTFGQISGLTSGSVFPVGTSSVSFAASDPSGNGDTCVFTVTVIDIEVPRVNCPRDTIIATDSGLCAAVFSYLSPVGGDNCVIDSLTQISGLGSGGIFPVGANMEVWAVLDPASNFDTCSFVVTVQDQENPVAFCRDLTVELDVLGTYQLSPAILDSGSTDNCGIDSLEVIGGNLTCANLGTQTITLMVYDAAGNSGSCSSQLTVLDTISPVAVCKDTLLYLNPLGLATLTPVSIAGNSFDNCGIDSLILSQAQFTCGDIGVFPVVVTAVDPEQNISSCTSTVTLQDTISPEARCRDTLLALDPQGQLTVSPSAIDAGSNDACGLDSLWLDRTRFTCQEIGVHLLTLTVRDANGNESRCNAELIVEDDLPPVVLCKDTILFLDSSGTAQISLAQLDDGSYDNCGIDTMEISQTQFGCQDLGLVGVIIAALDSSGNGASCVSQVIIEDLIAPEIRGCPPNQVLVVDSVTCNPLVNWVPPTVWDNCGQPVFTSNYQPNDSFPIGVTRVTYEAVDAAGNNELCTFTVNVIPRLLGVSVVGTPYLCGRYISCAGASDGTGTAAVRGGCVPYSFLWDTGDSTRTVNNLSAGWHHVTVTDGRGVSVTDSLFFTQPAPLSTNISGNLNICTTDTIGIIDLSITGGAQCPSAQRSYLWSTGATSEDLFNVPAGTYTVSITDGNGCNLTDTIHLNFFPPGIVSLGNDTTICPKTGYTLNPGAGYLSYQWSTGSTASTLNVQGPGTYSVLVFDQNGCDARDTISIAQYQSPQVYLGNDTTICNGDSLLLDAGAEFLDYLWSVGGTTQTHVVDTAGLTWVEVTDSNSCVERDSISIGVYFVANPNLQGVGPPTLCNDDTLRLVADPNFQQYAWSTGSSLFFTDVDTGGWYFLTVSDTSGCERMDSIRVTALPFDDPDPTIQPSGQVPLCQGASVSLDAGNGYTRYFWNTGDTAQTIMVDQLGYYFVTVYNGFGCSEQADTVFVYAAPNPQPVIQRNGDTLICTPPGVAYQWYQGSILLSGETNQTYYATQNGTYIVTMVDSLGCTGADTLDFVVGREALSGFEGIDLYPNPSEGRIHLRTYRPFNGPVEIDLVDVHGRVLRSYYPDRFDEVLTFDLNDFAAGIYLIRMKTERGLWQSRFMIE